MPRQPGYPEMYLCESPIGFCTDDPPVCPYHGSDPYQVNVPEGWKMYDREWQRDRVAFYSNEYLENPFFAPDNPPFIQFGSYGGWWRYWEGAGESTSIAPVYPYSVGLVRRYQRGLCSVTEQDVAEMLRTELESNVRSSFTCARNPYFSCERALRHADVLFSSVWQYFGLEDCVDIYSPNRDYYHLGYSFLLVPRRRVYESSRIRVKLDLWFQLGARRRSVYLDCPSEKSCDPDACYTGAGCLREDWAPHPGECVLPGSGCDPCFDPIAGCEDCERKCSTRPCSQNADCCGLPGVVCLDETGAGGLQVHGAECNQQRGVCEKQSFLDVIDYGISYRVRRLGKCTKGLDYMCYKLSETVKDELSDLQANAYRDIFAPLLQAFYERTWIDFPFQPCGSDQECHESALVGAENNFDSRCNMEYEHCEFRPMYFYGVNQYPDSLEVVLAWNSQTPEWTLLESFQGLYCKILSPDDEGYGWSSVKTSYDDSEPTDTTE